MSSPKSSVVSLFALLAVQAVVGGSTGPAASRFPRIVGGQLANDGEFGAIVSLAIPGVDTHWCGGSIIGPRHILTAGHCAAAGHALVVRAGIHDLRDAGNVVQRYVAEVYVHPAYIPYVKGYQSAQNDLAVLVLESPLPIGGRIRTIELPTQPPMQGHYITAGWGRNRRTGPTSYQYQLKTLGMSLCSFEDSYRFIPGTICAYADDGAVCWGDSGSPFTMNGHVYGVTSMSSCTAGDGSNFVNVHDYVYWIKAVLSK